MGKTNNRVVKLLLLYTLLLVLTSFIRSFESDNILINSSSFLLVFAIYIICIYTWSMSVWRRIIHTHVRTYLMRICGLMMFWVLIRTFRFASFNQIELINRYLRYSYSIILILIPLFSFFAALCIGKPENCRLERKFNLLYIPAIALMVGVMSNDFHQLAFKFPSGLGFWTENTIYERGIIFYLIVIWALGLFLGVVLILFKKSYTPFTKNQLWMPLIFIIVGIIYTFHKHLTVVYLICQGRLQKCFYLRGICYALLHRGEIVFFIDFAPVKNRTSLPLTQAAGGEYRSPRCSSNRHFVC